MNAVGYAKRGLGKMRCGYDARVRGLRHNRLLPSAAMKSVKEEARAVLWDVTHASQEVREGEDLRSKATPSPSWLRDFVRDIS